MPEPEPMTLAELQDGLEFSAQNENELEAAFCQVGWVLKHLEENGTKWAAIEPLRNLAQALDDLLGGNAAPLLRPQRKSAHKKPRRTYERRQFAVALLVEAFRQSWAADERAPLDSALEHVAAQLKLAGIERVETERQQRKPSTATAEEYLGSTLRHWWRNAQRADDWQERIDLLTEAGRWPVGPGDKAAAEALLQFYLPKLAKEFSAV